VGFDVRGVLNGLTTIMLGYVTAAKSLVAAIAVIIYAVRDVR
jgi:hypothetical protein